MEEITLFESLDSRKNEQGRPLAWRMRPCALAEFIGQEHLMAPGKLLRRMIESDCLQSVILWGPPGCGKNSLASLVAVVTKRDFVSVNAVEAGTQQLRKTVETARFNLKQSGRRTLLFIDEIHRFNKAQQDLLLPYVEEGDVTLIGATTHNPVFSLITALRSRSHVFELKPLRREDIRRILERAMAREKERTGVAAEAEEGAFDLIADKCGGDARIALNALELARSAMDREKRRITIPLVNESLPQAVVRYDENESEHHETISIFIKSMRGSDPDAAVYWLGKMLAGGEDPMFIARRLAIFASEDIGMADPKAILIADSAMRLVSEIGMPEARIILSHATVYMATAEKSNSSIVAIDGVMQDIEAAGAENVPEFVRKTPGEKKEKYMYSHQFDGGISGQDYRRGAKNYYRPHNSGYEAIVLKRMDLWKKIKEKRKSETK